MPLASLIRSWKTLALISTTLYLPCLGLTIYLTAQQNAAIFSVLAILTWISYIIHIMLVSSATTVRSQHDSEDPVLF